MDDQDPKAPSSDAAPAKNKTDDINTAPNKSNKTLEKNTAHPKSKQDDMTTDDLLVRTMEYAKNHFWYDRMSQKKSLGVVKDLWGPFQIGYCQYGANSDHNEHIFAVLTSVDGYDLVTADGELFRPQQPFKIVYNNLPRGEHPQRPDQEILYALKLRSYIRKDLVAQQQQVPGLSRINDLFPMTGVPAYRRGFGVFQNKYKTTVFSTSEDTSNHSVPFGKPVVTATPPEKFAKDATKPVEDTTKTVKSDGEVAEEIQNTDSSKRVVKAVDQVAKPTKAAKSSRKTAKKMTKPAETYPRSAIGTRDEHYIDFEGWVRAIVAVRSTSKTPEPCFKPMGMVCFGERPLEQPKLRDLMIVLCRAKAEFPKSFAKLSNLWKYPTLKPPHKNGGRWLVAQLGNLLQLQDPSRDSLDVYASFRARDGKLILTRCFSDGREGPVALFCLENVRKYLPDRAVWPFCSVLDRGGQKAVDALLRYICLVADFDGLRDAVDGFDGEFMESLKLACEGLPAVEGPKYDPSIHAAQTPQAENFGENGGNEANVPRAAAPSKVNRKAKSAVDIQRELNEGRKLNMEKRHPEWKEMVPKPITKQQSKPTEDPADVKQKRTDEKKKRSQSKKLAALEARLDAMEAKATSEEAKVASNEATLASQKATVATIKAELAFEQASHLATKIKLAEEERDHAATRLAHVLEQKPHFITKAELETERLNHLTTKAQVGVARETRREPNPAPMKTFYE